MAQYAPRGNSRIGFRFHKNVIKLLSVFSRVAAGAAASRLARLIPNSAM